MSAADRIEAATLADALRAAGFEHVPERIEPGRTARFPGLGARASDRAGWCVAFADGAGAAWGDWRSGASGTWFADDPRTLPPTERERLRRAAAEAREAAERERETEHRRAAEQARAILDGAPLATAHAYLSRKGIGPHGARIASDGRLLVPVYAPGGSLQSVQYVAEDGAKRFLTGGRLRGGWHRLGPDPRDCPDAPLLLAEGFATGATLAEATALPVWLAFTANNLEAVAKMLSAQFPDRRLLVCGDDDRATTGNPGRTKATAAAAAVGADVVFPAFPQDCNGSDFNDMAERSGQGGVARLITAALEGAKPANEPTAAGIVEAAIAKTLAGDAGALFELDALAALRSLDPPAWARTRARIKAGCRDVSVRELDRALRSGDGGTTEESSVADDLVTLVQEAAELLHTAEGDAYARIQQGEGAQRHGETWALHSTGFREWLAAAYYQQTGKAAREASLKDAVNALSGIAKHEGREAIVWLRVAEHDGRYYLDLCNAQWQAIEISPDGWQVLDHPPVLFRRTPTMRPLPEPARGGDLARLWQSVNVPQEARPLVLAWLLETLRPSTPFPVLEIIGEQGSGKSDTCERLRQITDPNAVNLRAAAKSVEDLFVAARNNWLATLNNLSHLSAPLQDGLCTLSTGGGFAGRTLFTNAEETVFETTRPVLLNGISSLATAQDLVDRTLRVELPLIAEDRRALASEMAARFEADRGAILGGLLDLYADTLRALPGVRLERLPRMADFARLGEAMTTARGWPSFADVYARHRRSAVLAALEASPVAVAMLRYLDRNSAGWTGTVQNLLSELSDYRHDAEAWPKSARGLADALRRLAPGLRVACVSVAFNPVRQRDGFHVEVKKSCGPACMCAAEIATPNHVHDVHDVHTAGEVF